VRVSASAVAAAAVVAAVACGAPDGEGPWTSPISFDTAQVWVHTGADSVPLLVELAETDAQRQFGLMTRPALDPGSGMAFLYDAEQPGEAGFYMFRTRVPLDIAVLDSEGTILTILSMEPCESPYPESCRIYEPGTPYWSTLEVNRGWFGRHEVGVGAQVEIERSEAP
jgi:hypothetical protein